MLQLRMQRQQSTPATSIQDGTNPVEWSTNAVFDGSTQGDGTSAGTPIHALSFTGGGEPSHQWWHGAQSGVLTQLALPVHGHHVVPPSAPTTGEAGDEDDALLCEMTAAMQQLHEAANAMHAVCSGHSAGAALIGTGSTGAPTPATRLLRRSSADSVLASFKAAAERQKSACVSGSPYHLEVHQQGANTGRWLHRILSLSAGGGSDTIHSFHSSATSQPQQRPDGRDRGRGVGAMVQRLTDEVVDMLPWRRRSTAEPLPGTALDGSEGGATADCCRRAFPVGAVDTGMPVQTAPGMMG